MAGGHKPERSSSLQEALSETVQPLQSPGQGWPIGISAQTPQKLVTHPPCVQQGPSDTLSKTLVPESTATPTTPSRDRGRRTRIQGQESSGLKEALDRTENLYRVSNFVEGIRPGTPSMGQEERFIRLGTP